MWRHYLYGLTAVVFTTAPVVAQESVNLDGPVSSNKPPDRIELFWKRDRVTAGWDGWRSRFENLGVDFSPILTGEVFGDVAGGGSGSGAVYDHSLNLPLTLDLEKLAGWKSATVYANAFWIAGRSLSEDCVGDIGNVSNISADPAFRLQELWLQQEAFDQAVSVKAGLIAVDSEFFTADSAALFINGSFGAFPLVGANLPNPPIYPMAAPAIRLRFQPTPHFYFQTAVFDGNSGSQDGNPNGINFPLAQGDGALLFSEVGFLSLPDTPHSRAGSIKAGGFVLTKHLPDWTSQAAGKDDGEQINFGVYGVAEQELFNWRNGKATVFVRGGYAPPNRNVVDWYFDAGFNFTGLVPKRNNDAAGIAVARAGFSHEFSNYEQIADATSAFDYEMIVEATYRAQIASWLSVQPDFQYVVTPGGDTQCRNAVVIGLRATLLF